MKGQRAIMALALVVVLILSQQFSVAFAKSQSVTFDRNTPVSAQDVRIMKKVRVKGGLPKPEAKASTAATGSVGSLTDGKKYAIVIGINDYPGDANDLQYAAADANAVENVLRSKYGFDATNITSLTSKCTRTEIYDTVTGLKEKLTSSDELVFFYSGHGAKGKAADGDSSNNDQAIVVWNGTTDADGFAFVWDGELKKLFDDFRTNRIVFIFDSCSSGGMGVLAKSGRIVNMACSASGYSYESSTWGGGHGQFTYYFAIQGMLFNNADTKPKDGKVTVEEAFDYTNRSCTLQKPVIADAFANDLLM